MSKFMVEFSMRDERSKPDYPFNIDWLSKINERIAEMGVFGRQPRSVIGLIPLDLWDSLVVYCKQNNTIANMQKSFYGHNDNIVPVCFEIYGVSFTPANVGTPTLLNIDFLAYLTEEYKVEE